MNIITKNHIKLHFTVILLGFTAILGKLISLNAIDMIWYRMFIAAFFLLIYIIINKLPLLYSFETIIKLTGVGLIIAIHWITFFHSIKISNVSVTLGSFASFAFFTSILEPVILRRKFKLIELVLGIVVMLGLYLIFRFEFRYKTGIIYSLISALLAALFTVFNKKFIVKHNPISISFYEMVSGFFWITIYLALSGKFSNGITLPENTDWIWLLILAVVCTSYAFVVSVEVMKVLSAYNVSLAVNMEPVYGIILASIIFKEDKFMSPGFYAGTAIIILTVFLFSYINYKKAPLNSP
ncbi:MAG: DMT family transporter [Chlorobi bacterium]|nr:DMT family transporter [Chlorobiota bacterium]